jgi:hypothetical protein
VTVNLGHVLAGVRVWGPHQAEENLVDPLTILRVAGVAQEQPVAGQPCFSLRAIPGAAIPAIARVAIPRAHGAIIGGAIVGGSCHPTMADHPPDITADHESAQYRLGSLSAYPDHGDSPLAGRGRNRRNRIGIDGALRKTGHHRPTSGTTLPHNAPHCCQDGAVDSVVPAIGDQRSSTGSG